MSECKYKSFDDLPEVKGFEAMHQYLYCVSLQLI